MITSYGVFLSMRFYNTSRLPFQAWMRYLSSKACQLSAPVAKGVITMWYKIGKAASISMRDRCIAEWTAVRMMQGYESGT